MGKKRIKLISLILTLVLAFTVLSACSPEGSSKTPDAGDSVVDGAQDNGKDEKDDRFTTYPLEIEDEFGNQVVLEKEPEKIVSLIPSHTETLYALGVGDKIVGIDPFSNYPEEAAEKEIVGDYFGTDLERIIELGVDLVLVYGGGDEEDNARLKEAGINVLGYLPETIEEVFSYIEEIGEIVDRQDEATSIIEEMKEKKEEIVGKVKDRDRVRAFYEIWHEPLQAAGPGSFMDELISLAGGENIAHDAAGAYAEYDLEQLVERDPQVYLTSQLAEPAQGEEEITAETISQRPGYEGLSAIKEERIYFLDGDIVSRPGPRIIEALDLVARVLHPDLF